MYYAFSIKLVCNDNGHTRYFVTYFKCTYTIFKLIRNESMCAKIHVGNANKCCTYKSNSI